MSNPFESESAPYLVVANEEEQYSLWPEFAEVPKGWHIVFGPADRQSCLDHVTAVWTDMRPASLVAAMDRADV
ncbi:MbtH family protein [Streptomyces sp. NPDC127106]|uniref:MbtH family protein n=1 Tax=Streptomyces sp. NPDC127106 TaxID=3345360 RepID=UPI0036440EDE